ncbi:hypothetical protein VTI74DRAFT_10459 [Chaetomium olivicolor]
MTGVGQKPPSYRGQRESIRHHRSLRHGFSQSKPSCPSPRLRDKSPRLVRLQGGVCRGAPNPHLQRRPTAFPAVSGRPAPRGKAGCNSKSDWTGLVHLSGCERSRLRLFSHRPHLVCAPKDHGNACGILHVLSSKGDCRFPQVANFKDICWPSSTCMPAYPCPAPWLAFTGRRRLVWSMKVESGRSSVPYLMPRRPWQRAHAAEPRLGTHSL